MDKDIADLVKAIDDILSFVKDVSVLKDKLERFGSTIEQILLTIDKCCSWIKKYLDTSTAGTCLDEVYLDILTSPLGQTWKVFVDAKQINDYKSELASLSIKLNGATVVHIARTTEVVFDEGMSFVGDFFCELR